MERLLLHICCGPCAIVVIERLRIDYDVTGFFYNPNIDPEDEYRRRLDVARSVTARLGVGLVEPSYCPDVFAEAVVGLELAPENGARCSACYRLRLARAAAYAAGHGFTAVASTLTAGRHKKAIVINPIGMEACEAVGVQFLAANWKERGGFDEAANRAREWGLYRQHYCGCRYSTRPPGTTHATE